MSTQFATFTTSRKNLLASVARAAKVAPSRSIRDDIKNVRLEVNGHVSVMSTDLELGYVEYVPNEDKTGEAVALVDAKRFTSLLRKIPGDNLSVSINGKLCIDTSGVCYSLDMSGDEFPVVNTLATGDHSLQVDGAELVKGLKSVCFATDVDSTRYALGGVLLDWDGAKLSMAATDSRRLAVADVSATGTEGSWEAVIPQKAVDSILAIADSPQAVLITFTKKEFGGSVTVNGDGWGVKTLIVEGRFPKYRQVVPQIGISDRTEITFDAAEARKALEAVKVVATHESRGCDLYITGSRIAFTCQSSDTGKAVAGLRADCISPCSAYAKAATCIGATFDPDYLLDYLKTAPKAGQVKLSLSDAGSAMRFDCEGAATYVLMPLSRKE